MGLAASQARLLTITARLADNELRSQTINNAKMRLATQSSQASDDYVNALNNARLMFSNTDIFGNAQTQLLNFNNLTSYSPYNTQYGLINSAGLALVSENEAAMFEKSRGDLNNYLELHGLEWETTYFDDPIALESKLTSFYDANTGLDYLFADPALYSVGASGKTGLQALYESYNSDSLSIEVVNYTNMAQEYYNALKKLYKTAAPLFRTDMIDKKTEEEMIQKILDMCAPGTPPSPAAGSIKNTILNGFTDGDYQLKGFNNIPTNPDWLTNNGRTRLEELINSLSDSSGPGGSSGFISGTEPFSPAITFGSGKISANLPWSFGGITINSNDKTIKDENTIPVGGYTITFSSSDSTTTWKYNGNDVSGQTITENVNLITLIGNIIKIVTETRPDGTTDDDIFTYRWKDENEVNILFSDTERENVYRAFIEEYFAMLLETPTFFDPVNYATDPANNNLVGLSEFLDIHNKFISTYGFKPDDYTNLIDFEKLMIEKDYPNGATYPLTDPKYDRFNNVIDAFRVELMIDVLGEPKYTWVDKNDTTNSGNPEAKAQWYTNLFNRMEQGYKVLEDGLASSSEWLEYAFESGLVSMEQVDSAFYWNALNYSTCSAISEETDGSEIVAKAEAKYKRAMNDIETKDKMYDMQLKNIDTEHSSLQTEYESIQKVINKNIERTMKFDQSA